LILEFLGVEPLPPELAVIIEAKRRWVSPPFSMLPFWRHEKIVRSYPIDRRKEFVFNQHKVAAMFGVSPNVVNESARQAFYDLMVKHREKDPKAGR
jgi:hypothetical protein